MSSNIGNVTQVQSETLFSWRIDNFHTYLKEVGLEYTSPVFFYLDACWRLRIKTESSERIVVCLQREDWGPPKTLEVKLGYLNKKEEKETYYLHIIHKFSEINANLKYEFRRNILVLNGDPLIIISSLKLKKGDHSEVSLFERLWNLSLSLKKIMTAGKESNIVLKVKDIEIPAHKMILESRSTVFERMFDSEMEQTRTGIIRVNDMEEDVLKIVLSYLYSGETEGLTSENVVQVYKAAHKYDLQDLRRLCVVFLTRSLNVHCVCDVIVLADLYMETNLMEKAKKFFVRNTSAIRKTDEWKSFKSENSALCCDLLDYMMEEM